MLLAMSGQRLCQIVLVLMSKYILAIYQPFTEYSSPGTHCELTRQGRYSADLYHIFGKHLN
jgi:hypothetical protein